MNNNLTVKEVFERGLEAHRSGNLPEADRYYTAVLKTQPNHTDANHNMGVIAVSIGKVEESLPFFQKAVEINPNIAQYWLSYLNTLIKLQKRDDAQALLRQARELGANGEQFNKIEDELEILNSQNPPKVKLKELKNLYASGRLKEALRKSEVLLEKFSESVDLYNIHGAIHVGLGKFEAAIVSYNTAIRLNPNSAKTFNNLGVALKNQGKPNQAIKAYQNAIAIKSDYSDAYYNLGNIFKETGEFELAINAYKSTIEINPNNADAYNNLGNVLKDTGNIEEAISVYQSTISVEPNNADAYNNLGNALKDQGKNEEAIEAYKSALLINPDYFEAQHMIAALTGQTPKHAPRKYVEGLFDHYAPNFDSSLVIQLEYNIPKVLKEKLLSEFPNGSMGSVLDLGCGTGLTGSEVSKFAHYLEGIDLSKSMLDQAKEKNIYDELVHSDILEYLSNKELNFDCFISTDVFIYVGDLSEVFNLIKSRNKKPAKLAFSTEHTDKDGFHIEMSGRYSHSKSYIENLCEQFGYKIIHFSTTNLRKEKESHIVGGIYILDFVIAANERT